MKRSVKLILFVILFSLLGVSLSFRSWADCTVQVEVRDVIGPSTLDLLQRAERMAEREECNSVFLLINTPGGSLETTRRIVESILNSPRPYLCLVAPSGGHAGSAGAIILQACHVNGALRGTNLGAATPVAMGKDLPKDLRLKIVNDTRSWLQSLTRLRHRSDAFGEAIIVDAKAVTAEDALKLNAIDFVGNSNAEFLKFAAGRMVKVAPDREISVSVGPVRELPLDLRYKLLSLLTDPELAYMMLLGSLALLYFEITHSGMILPGVVGAVGLVVALMALNRLEVEWAGLLLIFLGVAMLVAEMFLPSFGVVGVGGLVALALGSVFLFDPVKSGGYQLPYSVIAPVILLFAMAIVGVSLLLWRSRKIGKKGGFDDLMGRDARVSRVSHDSLHSGFIELQGETWKFESSSALNLNDAVKVIGHHGLILKVEKK